MVVLVPVLSGPLGLGERMASVQDWVRSLGPMGPVAYALVFAVASIAAFPGSLLAIAGGGLFGPVAGVLSVMVGESLGAAVSFLVARHLAREPVARRVASSERLARLDRLVARNGDMVVAFTRLVPVFPLAFVNYAFGLTGVGFGTYVLWTAIGSLPGTVVYVVGAAAMVEGLAEGRVPWVLVGVVVSALAVVVVLGRRLARRIAASEDQPPGEGARPAERRSLIVMTRYPEAGAVKTRLAERLGADAAAELHRAMAEHTVSRLRGLAAAGEADLEVRFTGGPRRRVRAWLGRGVRLVPQGEGDLARRLARAFEAAFECGASQVVAVGTDCPELSADTVRRAYAALNHADVVLGRATDGGYYLIGLGRRARDRGATTALFASAIPWGTGEVFALTRRAAADAGLAVAILDEVLGDVDRPGDLGTWERVRGDAARGVAADALVSVIVPALDEAERLASTLARAGTSPATEIIVVDGGSADATREIARHAGARVMTAAPGRARQMNTGASAAQGTILLFLHADTMLPEGFASLARETLARPGVAAGAFRFATDLGGAAMRVVELLADARSHHLGLPYGDQALFVRADTFRDLGGFPDIPVLEDLELARRLGRLGRVVTLQAAAVTSGRAWEAAGVVRTSLRNALAAGAYLCGVPADRIAGRLHE